MLPSWFLLGYSSFAKAAVAEIDATKSRIILPKPSGPFQVGRSIAELIDTTRNQTLSPNNVIEPVRLMITVYYPVKWTKHTDVVQYMSPKTAQIEDLTLSALGLAAPNGTLEKVAVRIAGKQEVEKIDAKDNSLVFFMPGENSPRAFYGQIAASIASKGYTVVAIDAPYDVDVVEYTDGSLALNNQSLWGTSDQEALLKTAFTAIKTRAEDVSFVLDSLSNKTLARSLIPNLPDTGLNTTHAAMFGHSLGGSTAFSVLGIDDRLIGGIDMDGGLYGPSLPNGTDKPFMFMGRENHTRENIETDPILSWQTEWPSLKGWRRHVIVAGALHYDFSDYPILFEKLGITPVGTVATDNIFIGSLSGARALEIVTDYVGAFLDFVVHGKPSKLLDGPVKEFPEITFEN
jgi:hypothetical protein